MASLGCVTQYAPQWWWPWLLGQIRLVWVATTGSRRLENIIEEATIAALQQLMGSWQLTARQLVHLYLDRIEALDRKGPTLRSILEVNANALMTAEALDAE